ncbi:FAD-binding domain-containing protein [Penicillium verhagenii]|uniref:FAD-binding domain-containing protein n=1 Tax=Penicillium verhagenii TaxID=1562060 RepID=UPI0025456E42|nr:FAD-binding domain-containing protein [Penicillium verhagenii]KAJ5936915.1 FAD-binding domain-containing protein [Penicillium verhagenii]
MASPMQTLIQAGLKEQLLLPSQPEYHTLQAASWSKSARLSPAAILRPRSASEVSTALHALITAGRKFAIRSGGHTQYPGANDIDGNGVTIDLGLLDWTRYDPTTETVEIGPGTRWKQVYAALREHGRVVAGGRDGNVGVAGLLLGGGKTFFAAQRGFACDDVVSFEVVVAGGNANKDEGCSVVTASAEEHPDLFRALKGGSNNFGIVTNFTMRALVCESVWAGLNFFPKERTEETAQALVNFTDCVDQYPDSHLLYFLSYTGKFHWSPPAFHDIVVVTAYVQLAGIVKAPAYQDFLALDPILDTTKITTVENVVSEYDIAPPNYHNNFFTSTFKNDTRVVAKAASLHQSLVDELKAFIPDGDFITQCLLQPLPTRYGQLSALCTGGDNIMNVSAQPVNGLLFVAVAMVRTPEQEAFVYPRLRAWVEALKAFATDVDPDYGNLEWVYMNYADKSQKVLESYGKENLKLMRAVAARYDPGQVFQTLCPGGFKLTQVRD